MLLERDAELATLHAALDDIGSSGGKVILVRGEVGIGKTVLVDRFAEQAREDAHVLLGSCDDLLTPQPLGPIWDIARLESTLSEPLVDGDRRAVMEAVLDLLSRSIRPTVLILEDTQWADEATLDLIKFLGRRIARTNGLLILTYRDVEVDSEHPLRQVIGDLPIQNVIRVPLARLSTEGVASLIESESFDVDEVLTLTSGNPLFVTEVVASGIEIVPASIRDTVLARASRVSPGSRRVLDLMSVVPGDVPRLLVDELIEPTDQQLIEIVRQGLLRINGDTLTFTHDLQRRAIESALSASDRRSLNQLVLDSLDESADPARLAHHAREAGDDDKTATYSLRAAQSAMAIESTTEAVAHFRTIEQFLDRFDSGTQAAILTDWASLEFYLDNPESVELAARAVDLHEAHGDDRSLARTLILASRVSRSHAKPAESLDYATAAVTTLEPYEPSADLARALSHRAFVEFVYRDADEAVLPLVNRAMSIAEETGDDQAMVSALNVKAHLIFSRGDMSGMALMEESLRIAERNNDHWGELRALTNIAGMSGDIRDMARATDFARRTRDTAARYENRSIEREARSTHSEFLLWQGNWSAAENEATEALGANPGVEILAWRVLGTIQARRGRKEARVAILRMWSMIQPGEGPTAVDPAAAALAEYMWLSGDDDPELMARLDEVLAEGVSLGTPWPSGALAFWMWKLGRLELVPEGTADFYGWIIKGEHQKAAEFWRRRSIPYEEGLALMHGDESEQLEAVRMFEELGATAIAAKVRKSLADDGVKVPRGRARATRGHVAGLTPRQAEVLNLLAEGLTNSEIADDLFVSHRTVENHVSAVLMKLDVPNRDEAVIAARDQGILDLP